MYERMSNKQEEPTIAQMTAYCGACADLFTLLNEWLSGIYGTAQAITFPYGNQYGWGVAHRINKKLICHVFAEENAFTVMMRLSNDQFDSVYHQLRRETQEQIDHKYPCGNGGWLHYRVTCREQLVDIQNLLTVKCTQASIGVMEACQDDLIPLWADKAENDKIQLWGEKIRNEFFWKHKKMLF